MTGPGRKDTHPEWESEWERQEELGRDSTAANGERSFKLLVEKRWTVQEKPFEGFNSPPGRF